MEEIWSDNEDIMVISYKSLQIVVFLKSIPIHLDISLPLIFYGKAPMYEPYRNYWVTQVWPLLRGI